MAIYSEEVQMRNNGSEWSMYKVFDNQQTTATSDPIDVRNALGFSFVVVASVGTTNGVVTVEGSHDSAFTGTWHAFDTLTTLEGNKIYLAGKDFSSAEMPVKYVRARITTAIGGGNVDVWVMVQRL